MGLLGKNILGSGFDFDVKVSRGGGAFVCGESTALMASIEGKVGEPRAKHIHTVVSGLWDRPTNLNNVETWANVPLIIDKGADGIARSERRAAKGRRSSPWWVRSTTPASSRFPWGLLFERSSMILEAGFPEGKKFKAVQTGGPSGGCIPESLIDLPVDFDRLTEVGSMMGSGGMIVMDESTCMVDVAKYFMNFLKDESCGKCTSCREGTKRMHEILTDITEGRGTTDHLDLLEELGWVTAEASLCRWEGPPPILFFPRSVISGMNIRNTFVNKRCPAKVCRALLTIESFPMSVPCADGVRRPVRRRPSPERRRPKRRKGIPFKIDETKCIKCGMCFEACKFEAVEVNR